MLVAIDSRKSSKRRPVSVVRTKRFQKGREFSANILNTSVDLNPAAGFWIRICSLSESASLLSTKYSPIRLVATERLPVILEYVSANDCSSSNSQSQKRQKPVCFCFHRDAARKYRLSCKASSSYQTCGKRIARNVTYYHLCILYSCILYALRHPG